MRITKKVYGFLLTEVLITIVLIAITMLAIVPIIFAGIGSSKISKNKAFETNIAQQEIESFKQQNFSTVLSYVLTKNANFKLGTLSNVYDETTIQKYINPVNWEVKDSLSPGFFPLVINKKYQFLNDLTQSSEAIQLTVTVAIQKPNTQPVKITSVISRDK